MSKKLSPRKGVWRHIATTNFVDAHRTGWLGVWDALKAAITGNKRLSVPTQCSTELWIRVENDEKLSACGTAEGVADGYVDGVLTND